MIVMPSNASGWLWHCLARETNKIGHLHSHGHQRGPWPWLPYALDNGCFSLWDPVSNTFDEHTWLNKKEQEWKQLVFWAECNEQKALWLIVPDRPGSRDETLKKWDKYTKQLSIPFAHTFNFSLAIAVQNGMTVEDVRSLSVQPDVICVGGTTEWKEETAPTWAKEFKRTHYLRCNAPLKLPILEKMGFESCDGTGWNRGDRKQTEGLETWARGLRHQTSMPLWKYACRGEKKAARQLKGQPVQLTFA